MSLEEFCCLPRFRNFYSQYLFAFNLSHFDFIGLTETYDDRLTAFCHCFHLENNHQWLVNHSSIKNSLVKNHNPNREGHSYDIDPALQQIIEQYNQKDYQLYQQACQINERLIKEFL
jgi:hypothetical protein